MRPIPASAFQNAQIIPFVPRSDGAELLARLSALSRPARLLSAARIGMGHYERRRDLRRILRQPDLPGPRAALARLLALEAEADATRRDGRADYDVARHLSLLIAALCEGRALVSAGLEDRPEDAAHHCLPGA